MLKIESSRCISRSGSESMLKAVQACVFKMLFLFSFAATDGNQGRAIYLTRSPSHGGAKTDYLQLPDWLNASLNSQ